MITAAMVALSVFGLAVLTLAAIDDRKRQQQIADRHWRDVERH
jgi:hypothetical protein